VELKNNLKLGEAHKIASERRAKSIFERDYKD